MAFRLTQDADIDRTHLLEEVEIAPKRLVELFGPPAKADDYKVSGQYAFTDGDGNVFTVYDWKATTLFAKQEYEPSQIVGVPTPEEFWSKADLELFSIGGRQGKGDVAKFKEWLLEQVK